MGDPRPQALPRRRRTHPRLYPDFPEIEAEFHLSIRNTASFLPGLFAKQRGKPYDEFMGNADPRGLSWSAMVEEIRTLNPDAPLTIWCDEDTPLIWPEVLQTVSGHAPDTVLDETDELLASLMPGDGLARMNAYLVSNPPASATQRRRIVSAFLDKFALPDQIETEVELPGWDEALLEELNESYRRDIARIRSMEGVTFLSA